MGGGGQVVPVVSISSSASTSTYGSNVTFSILITPSSCGASDFISISDNGTSIGSTTLSSSGTGSFATSSLAVGSHTIAASYAGGKVVGTSTCDAATGSVTQTVNQATPSISISDLPGNAIYGGSFTATYNYSGNGSPSESVSSSTTGVCTASGSAVSLVGVGTCTLTASATATTDYTAVTGSAQSLNVGQATPSISVNDLPGNAIFGGNFTATYNYSGNGSPSESVSSSTTGVCTASGSAVSLVGVGTCTLTPSATATTDYTAVTGGSQSFSVGRAAPTISLSTSGTPSVYGTAVTFTATVSSGESGTLVTFYDAGTTIGSATVSGSTAAYTTSSLADGTHTITAGLAATTDYSAVTSSAITQTVLLYDAGTVALTIGGKQVTSASYGQGSTPATVAASLAGSYSAATVQAVDNTLYVEASATGSDPTYSLAVTSSNPAVFPTPSFAGSPSSGTLVGGAGSDGSPQPIYSYSLTYDADSRITGYTDAVMGTWANVGYDTLNRMTQSQNTVAPASGADYASMYLCWSYDAFGNRTAQVIQASACPTPESSLAVTAKYTANNQVSWVQNSAPAGFAYDAAGDETADSVNQYRYDGEGRVCAVWNTVTGSMTGYMYNAEGIRVAKGTLTSFSCNLSANGFQTVSDYVLGPGDEQAAELDRDGNGKMAWQHSNAWAGGQLLATYDPNGLHFYANDWQGTRRVQTDSEGVVEQSCQSLPFGDQLNCTASNTSPTEHHFTGKERDQESGNDYFEARYYESTMGRFMTPDWDAKPMTVPYASFGDPQTLNLYAYVENGPLNRVDADGHFSQPLGHGSTVMNAPCGSAAADMTACDGDPLFQLNYSADEANYEANLTLAQEQQASASTGNNAAQPAQQQSGTVAVIVGQRPTKNIWSKIFSFFLAKHSYFIVEGDMVQVLGNDGSSHNQQVRINDPTRGQRDIKHERTVWVSQAQADALIKGSEYFAQHTGSGLNQSDYAHPCPTCTGGQEGYNFLLHKSNSFVYNMLNSDPAGKIPHGSAPLITPGWAMKPDDWYPNP
jgi:RHS repeat-associated protein